MSLSNRAPTLLLAIDPVIRMPVLGRIPRSMTSRFGRVIKRSCRPPRERHRTAGDIQNTVPANVRVLRLPARIIRAGIAPAVLGALAATLLIIRLVRGSLLPLGSAIPVGLYSSA